MLTRRHLLRPKWLLSHVLVVAIAVTFILLGLWQLDRHQERVEDNELVASRLERPASPLNALLSEAAGEWDRIEYRRATATGSFVPTEELLIRSQVHLGAPGFHLITPLDLGGGEGILVNRGWVPIIYDSVPVEEAGPEAGTIEVEGWVRLSQERPTFGPTDPPEGRLAVLSRIDIARIDQQVSLQLAPIYLVMSNSGEGLPDELRTPNFDDTGAHLGYAIQWFGFAVVGLVGYVFLVRRRLHPKARPSTTS